MDFNRVPYSALSPHARGLSREVRVLGRQQPDHPAAKGKEQRFHLSDFSCLTWKPAKNASRTSGQFEKAMKERITQKPPVKSQGLQERCQKPWDDAEKQIVWRTGQEMSWSIGHSQTQPEITVNHRAEPCSPHQPALTTTQPKAGSQDAFQGKKVPRWKLPERTSRRWD